MRRGTGCIRRREAFGWGPCPIAATEGRATEGEAGSRATSFGRGKAAQCVVEPDAFVDAKHLDGAPTPSRPPRAALQKAKPVPGPHPSAVVKRRNASWNRMRSSTRSIWMGALH